MDIVLEIFDTFGFDYFYSAILPAGPVPYDLSNNGAGNSTTLPLRELSTWQYRPATQWFSLTPHDAAYTSAWNRDNMYRQGLSLFLITWLVLLLSGSLLSND
jgi:lathosterol oxidase